MKNNSTKYREAYNKGEEIIPDYIYDEMFTQDEAELDDTGCGELVEHLNFMGSLPTHFTNIEELTWETLSKMGCKKNDTYTVSYKVDGVPGSCWYNTKTGKCDKILSRGKRLEGYVMADSFKSVIPSVNPDLLSKNSKYADVRGEFVIYETDFEEINSKLKENGDKPFANTRSMVSASVNSLNPNPLIMSKMHFKAHGIWEDGKPSLHFERLAELLDKDYITPNVTCTFDELIDVVKNEYRTAFGSNNIIPVDGIVIQHSTTTDNDGHCNLDRIAVKQLDEKTFSAESVVRKIEWKVNTSGEYIPRIWFDTVVIDGTDVQKCAGFCYDFIVSKGISVGAKVYILKRGGVIPYLHKVIEPGNGDIQLPEDCEAPEEGDIHVYINNRTEKSNYAKFKKGGLSLEIDTFGDTFWEDLYVFMLNEGFKQPTIFDVIEYCRLDRINKIISNVIPNTKNGWERLITFKNVMRSITFEKLTIATCSNGIGEKTAKLIGEWLNGGPKPKETKYIKEFLSNTELIEKIKTYGIKSAPTVAFANTDKKKVIMSKKPTNGMKKADFFNKYLSSEYILTEDIKEANLLICPEGETSSKIKYAEKNNIEIKHYSDFLV